jgi:hypothetical protein
MVGRRVDVKDGEDAAKLDLGLLQKSMMVK